MSRAETLSKHICESDSVHDGYIHAPWVKEFIKELKKSIEKDLDNGNFTSGIKFAVGNMIDDYIDKLAGEKLI